MATSFITIRKFIRAALLDTDKDCFMYSDEALDDQIRFTNLYLGVDDAAFAETGSTAQFTGDLTASQVLSLSLKTAIRILTGIPDQFSYQTPVISASRRGASRGLLASLTTLLSESEGGGFAIAIDTDFDALTQGFQRFYNGVSQSDSAWSGIFTEG